MKEQEYKFLQSKTVFLRQIESIRRCYPGAVQTDSLYVHYYYDTPDGALHKENVTMQIRQKEEKLTGKITWNQNGGHDELDGFIGSEYPFICERLPQKIFYEGKEAILQGTLITKRSSFLIVPGVRMHFDRVFYLGICDYEVIIQFGQDKAWMAADLVKRFGLSNANGERKSTRFYGAKKMLDLCMQIGIR